ncbi:ATP-binding cassette domain-containing protein [Mammaliicoccus sciuri]|uniref:ATP-binding cassette domain-containing protein n=1 Tax=Mammaliicoccus sciuri TaxID=1296 RepID=UPI000D1E70E4|nr:ABC transporter ATP-binding protein [Mammaliicoccus sciuri]PTJ62204.1 ABC transporter ATP-binding protein [Mammaliicoccus sciuri]
MNKETLLEVKNLTKKDDTSYILSNLNFKIPKGSKVGYLGLNGAGKTTTFKSISYLTTIDSGEIILDDEVLKKNSSEDIVFMPDYPLVYESLTGKEYLLFMEDLMDIDILNHTSLIHRFDIHESLNKKIETYSLGMKKKISLIPILIKQPKVLLLDEFLSNIDPLSSKIIKHELNDFVRRGNSIVLSSHHLDTIENFCEYIIIIKNGEIIGNVNKVSDILLSYYSLEQYFESKLKEVESNAF